METISFFFYKNILESYFSIFFSSDVAKGVSHVVREREDGPRRDAQLPHGRHRTRGHQRMSLSQECQGIFTQFLSSTDKHQSIFIVSGCFSVQKSMYFKT